MTTAHSPGATTFTTPSDTEVVISRVFDAPRQLVFDAWTDPKHIPHWMLGPGDTSMPVCEVDLRPGGAWYFVWHGTDGFTMEMRGVYREVAPPERLVSTESWGGPFPETVNTLVLTEEDAGRRTRTTLTITYPSKEARDAAMATGMADGLTISYGRLDEHLRSQPADAS